MKKKSSARLSDCVVQAKDCYDPRDFVLVHKDYLARLLAVFRSEEAQTCDAVGQRTENPT